MFRTANDPSAHRSANAFTRDRQAAVTREWDALIASALDQGAVPATAQFSLPEGVVDTRPHGTRIIDLRDGVRLIDGVMDARPSSGALGIDALATRPVRTGHRPVAPSVPTGPFTSGPFETVRSDDAAPVVAPAPSVPTVPSFPPAAPEPEADPFLLDTQTRIVRRRKGAAATRPEAPRRSERFEPPAPATVAEALELSTPANPVPQADTAATSPYMRRSELRRLEARASRRRPTGALSVPQVGIASALGLATIAAPLTGALSAPAKPGVTQLNTSIAANTMVVAAAPAVQAAPFPQTVAAQANALSSAQLVADDARVNSGPGALAAPSRVLVGKASANGESAVLPGCDGVVPASAKNAGNGKLPASAMCTLWQKDQKLRADAAVALAKLNVAYKQAMGKDLCVTDSYRTLGDQFVVKRLRGGWAAAPGTSNHGTGTAIDLCGGSAVKSTSTYTWLRANGARYGWTNPEWARTTLPEPWHWEYTPA